MNVCPAVATAAIRWFRRLVLGLLIVLPAFAAEPPAEPELFGREPRLQLSSSALVFDQRITLRVSEADIERLFPGQDGKPLAKLRPGSDATAPRIRAETVKLWIGRQYIPVEVLSTKPSGTPGEFEVGIFVPLPPEMKTDTYKADEAKEALKRRVARLEEWSVFGLWGRRLPVTAQISFTWQDAPGGRVSKPLLVHAEVIVRLISYAVSAVALGLVVFAIVLAFFAAGKTRMLFDSREAEFTARDGSKFWRWQYSLSRVQGFGWLFIVFFGVLFLYATTGSLLGVMNPTALALLGMGSGTAFVGLLLDQAPPEPGVPLLPVAPAGETIRRPRWRDMLPDVLDTLKGGNLHRLQIVIWTVSLMIVYLNRLFATYTLPEFDGTMLGLMGISSATYLAFKDREKR